MGSKASTPPPIDYAAQAAAQGTANQAAAVTSNLMNNPNQVNPYGSVTYSGPQDGTGRATQTQTLSPAEQQKLDLTNQASTYSLQQLNQALPSLLSGLGGFNIPGTAMSGYDPSLDPKRGYQLDTGIGTAPAEQNSLDFSGASAMPTDDAAAQKTASDAAYNQQTAYLDPQYAQQQKELTDNLANQGIQPGSEAYTNAMNNFNDTKQKAYSDARNSAVGIGNTQMNTQFQNDLAARGQSTGEITTAGNFANSARDSYINQLLNSMNTSNNALSQQYNTAAQSTTLNNAGRAQTLNEQATEKTLPINILNGLLSSSQVTNPNFQPFTQNTNVEAAPLMQAAQLQGQQNTAASNSSNAKGGQTAGAIGSVATTAAMIF